MSVCVRNRAMVALIGGLACVMVVPPTIAGIFGSLGLAVVVGVVSILFGLVGMSVLVSRWEIVLKRSPQLPNARVIKPTARR